MKDLFCVGGEYLVGDFRENKRGKNRILASVEATEELVGFSTKRTGGTIVLGNAPLCLFWSQRQETLEGEPYIVCSELSLGVGVNLISRACPSFYEALKINLDA